MKKHIPTVQDHLPIDDALLAAVKARNHPAVKRLLAACAAAGPLSPTAQYVQLAHEMGEVIHEKDQLLAAAQARVAELEGERRGLQELAVAAATDLRAAVRLRAEAAATAAAAAADLRAVQRLRGEAAPAAAAADA